MKTKSTLRKIATLFEPEQVNSLISKTENSILEVKIQQEQMQNEYEAAKVVVEKYNNLQSLIEQDEKLLSRLIQYKTGKSEPDTVVYSKMSNTRQKHKGLYEFSVIKSAIALIKHENRAFHVKQLVSLLAAKHKQFEEYINEKPQHKHSAAHTLLKTKKLGQHNKKIGLKEWFDASGTPKNQFITLFMDL